MLPIVSDCVNLLIVRPYFLRRASGVALRMKPNEVLSSSSGELTKGQHKAMQHPLSVSDTLPQAIHYRAALSAYERGDFDEAHATLESSILSPSAGAAASSEMLAAALLLAGNVHATRGEIAECDRRYREAYEVLSVAFGESHVGHATVVVNHSAVLIRRYQVICQESPSPDDAETHRALIEEALRMLMSAYAILEPVLGVNRIILADCCHNIGVCLETKGHFIEALEYYMKSLKIRCRVRERTQLTQLCISTTSENIAMIYRQMQRNKNDSSCPFLERAQQMMVGVLEIRQRILGPLSGGVAEAHFNLALINRARGNPKQAQQHFAVARKIRTDLFGKEHELTALAEVLV